MTKENKQKKNRKIPLAVKIIVGILLGIIALFVIAMLVIWIISPELFVFIITFVIPNLPKLLTGNNMKAAWILFTNDNAAIVEQIDRNQQQQSDTLGISAEVLAAIESGNYTEEEIALILDTKGEALAFIDAEKFAATTKPEQDVENADGVDDIMAELSPGVVAAIESGKYTQEEIALIIDTKGEAISKIDEEKEKQEKEQEQEKQPEPSAPSEETVTPSEPEVSQTPTQTVPENEQQIPPITTTPEDTSSTPPTPSEGTGGDKTAEETTSPEPEAPVVNVGEIVNKHVAKLYIIKNRFVTELASVETKIKAQYGALPKDQKVPASRKEIAKQYISVVSDLELECDAAVDEILAQLKAELQAAGADISIVDTVRTQYEEEKSLKKAYYLDVYMNGLPDKEQSSTSN